MRENFIYREQKDWGIKGKVVKKEPSAAKGCYKPDVERI